MKFGFDLDKTADGMIRLGLLIEDEIVWPHRGRGDGCSDFDPEDVLSYLSDAWPSLLLSQVWPIQFSTDEEPRSVTGLLRAAEERWEQFGNEDQAQASKEQSLINEFLYHHDLSQMKHGAGLPSCYVLKQLRHMKLEAGQEVFSNIAFSDFVQQLTCLGDFAANLLSDRIAGHDGVAVRLKICWDTRDEIDPSLAAALICGIPLSDMENYTTRGMPLFNATSGRKLTEIANDNSSPIYAAARCSGVLGPAGMIAVLDKIQSFTPGDPKPLANHRRSVRGELRDVSGPTDQGIRAALIVRQWLHLREDNPVNLEELSALLGIHVDRADIADERLDGIASANAQHGPAILLNRSTRRHGGKLDDLERSLRFTWTHEIGHLLLDDEEWPALIDAALQRVPRAIETRANAFATYLLLPTTTAYRKWETDGMPLSWAELEETLNSLSQIYGLPRIAAAKQLARGAPIERKWRLDDALMAYVPGYGGPKRQN